MLAPIDLPAIQERLQVVANEVLENDPKKLRARIAELERLAKSVQPTVVEKPVMSEADFDRFSTTVNNLRTILSNTLEEINKASVTPGRSIADFMGGNPGPADPALDGLLTSRAKGMTPPMKVAPHLGVVVTPQNGSSEIGKSGLRRMLIALAQNPQGLTDSKLGLRADVSTGSGNFNNCLSRGRVSGWIEGERTGLRITKTGLDALGSFDPLPTGKALLEHWISKLGRSAAGRMLEELARVHPRTLSDHELGQRTSLAVGSGNFNNSLSRLRGFDLISGSRSALRASEEFFT